MQPQSVHTSRRTRSARADTARPVRLDGALFHTGNLPTSALSLPINYLMQTIAATPSFQNWTATTSPAAALGRVYTPFAPPDAPLPYAIVDVNRAFSREKIAGGSRNFFEGHGSLSLWLRSVVANGTDKDQAYDFENHVGELVTDMELLAGTAGYLDIERVELADGPYRPEEDERAALTYDFYEILLRVEYRSL